MDPEVDLAAIARRSHQKGFMAGLRGILTDMAHEKYAARSRRLGMAGTFSLMAACCFIAGGVEVALAATMPPALTPQAAKPETMVEIDIPPSRCIDALIQLLLQAQVEVRYLDTTLKDVETRQVKGRMRLDDALRQMFADTGVTFDFTPNGRVYLNPPQGSRQHPEKDQTVAVPRELTMARDSSGMGPNLGEMMVTGTHIRGNLLDLVTPVTVIEHDEIKRSSYGTVQDVLQQLPINLRATQNEVFGGTGNFAKGSGLNLLGLGSGATLVLVDGRRVASAGTEANFVDVSNIPWSMVEKIEIVPDGSSALYGSDAIAGVVNIILRHDLDGAESLVKAGTAADGAAETLAAQLLGRRYDSGHWLLGYQYSQKTALAASARDYTANSDKRPLGGSDFRTVRSNPANIFDPVTFAPAYAIPSGQNGVSLAPSDLLSGTVNLQNRFEQVELLPNVRMHSVYLTASQKLNDWLEAFVDGRYNRRSTDYDIFAVDQIFSVPSSNPFFVNPIANGPPFVIVGYNFLHDLGPIRVDDITTVRAATVGLTASPGDDWRVTLSRSYGEERLAHLGFNTIDSRALSLALADPNPATAFNPFADGSNTNPQTLNRIRFTQNFPAKSSIATASVAADGSLHSWRGGAIKLATGAEHRTETLDRAFQPAMPQHFARKVSGIFGEVSAPLVNNQYNPHDSSRLELSLAGRYETYSDFGTTINPKIGLRWTPWTWLKLRSSWGTSYKAPTLVQLYDTSQRLSVQRPLPDPKSPSGQTVVFVEQGSNPNLKEERSKAWTAGVDITPISIPGLTLSLTGYTINYKDQVIQPGGTAPFQILLHETEWASVIRRNPSRAEIVEMCQNSPYIGSVEQCKSSSPLVLIDARLTNLSATATKGFDFRVDYGVDASIGRFDFRLAGNRIVNLSQQVTPTSSVSDLVGLLASPPSLRMRGTVEWRQRNTGGFNASAILNYASPFKNPESAMRPNIGRSITLDVTVGYRTTKGGNWWNDIDCILNAANILGSNPPFADVEYGFDPFNQTPVGTVIGFYLQKNWSHLQ